MGRRGTDGRPRLRRRGFGGRFAPARVATVPYRRREPEKTVLYAVVREHLETFPEEARRADGEGYPRFVEQAFRRYLDCGLLCHGFARLRSPRCGFERFVAFSCKGRIGACRRRTGRPPQDAAGAGTRP